MNKVCPTCRFQYGGGEVFCPVDASRLVNTSQMGGKPLDPDDPLVGTLLAGRYEVIRRVGEGGMGLVYEGKHRDIDKPVAIKVLRDDLSGRPEVVARFRQEAKSASRIGHRNIVNVSDFGETQFGASYFVMEYLEGEDLANVLGREGTIAVDRTCRIVLQCCHALGAAHDKKIVHRDIKPENIFLTAREGNPEFVKIVDFGIAKMGDIETEGQPGRKLTKTGMIFGTPEYMSPEQAAGKDLDHRVDIYALGIILYECLAGTVPFVGDTFMGVLTQHLFAKPPRIVESNPEAAVSPEIELVISKALAKDPNDRYQTTAELAEAVECALDGRVSTATAVSAARAEPLELLATDPAPPPIRHKPRWVWGVAVSCALAIGVWLGLGTSSKDADASEQAPNVATPAPVTVAEADDQLVEPTPTDASPVEAEIATVVDVHVATQPAGGAVFHADGSPACEQAPCTLVAVRGTPLILRARLGKRTGRTLITPTQEETVLIELKTPRRVAAKPRNSTPAKPRRTKSDANRASDLKVPAWAR
ncbi:MAG: protein kinase [Myxococcota bacterium]